MGFKFFFFFFSHCFGRELSLNPFHFKHRPDALVISVLS